MCGREFKVPQHAVKKGRGRFCSPSCAGKAKPKHIQVGELNPSWKGGLTKSSKGYWYVRKPDHPRAGKNGYVKRADLVAEQMLGRPLLPEEEVHHKNRNKEDDAPDNLEALTRKEHARLHGEERRVAKPPKVRSTDPRTKRYNWPPDDKLLEERKHKTLQEIADRVGCSVVAVFYRLRKIGA